MTDKLKKKFIPVYRFLVGMSDRRLMVYATSCTYYFFICLIPITMLLCCLIRYTPFTEAALISYVDAYFSSSLATLMRRIVKTIYLSGAGTLTISILLTFFSATASVRQLMKGMNAAYDIRNTRSVISGFLYSFLLMLILLFTVLLVLAMMLYGGRMLRSLSVRFPEVTVVLRGVNIIRYVLILLFLFIVFRLMYTYMPAVKIKGINNSFGAAFASVMWVLFSELFSRYIDISHQYGAYGIIGTIIIALFWLQYIMYFLLIGGYINSRIFYRKNLKEAAASGKTPAEVPEKQPGSPSPEPGQPEGQEEKPADV